MKWKTRSGRGHNDVLYFGKIMVGTAGVYEDGGYSWYFLLPGLRKISGVEPTLEKAKIACERRADLWLEKTGLLNEDVE